MPENHHFIPTAVIRDRTSGGVGGTAGVTPPPTRFACEAASLLALRLIGQALNMDISLINSQSLLQLLSLVEKKEQLLQVLQEIDAAIIDTFKGGSVSADILEVAKKPASAVLPPAPAATMPVAAVKAPSKPAKVAKKKSKMSPEGRARIGAAAKARWAARRAGKPTPDAAVDKPVAAKPIVAKSASPKPVAAKKKGGISSEGRAKIAAASKARWAKVRTGKASKKSPKA